MASNIEVTATNVANQIQIDKGGADPSFSPAIIIPILQILLPMLANCWKQASPAEGNPADYLKDHYDLAQDEFSTSIMDHTKATIRRSLRQAGTRHNYGKTDIEAMAKTTLKTLMKDPGNVTNCMSEINN